jgi:putative transcriptional regulator
MGNRVRELRTSRAWSQADLGERLAVSRQAVNAIENGKHDPSLSLAFRIARLFGKSVDSIFDQEEQESSIKTSGVMREPT